MTFRELGLIAPILTALGEQGYHQPSPIQVKAIPPALDGRDVLGCAQTGTGKTCAFATPILQRLNAEKPAGRPIRALILTPTRELAIQIGESFAEYGKHLPLRTAVIFGGVGQAPQVEQIRRGVDIVVATPGRLSDLYQQKLLELGRLEILVLDEADRMLDMGFIHDVKRILSWLPAKKQTMFFSATMPPEITELVNCLLHNPVRVAVNPVSSPVEAIRQSVYFVDRGNKTKLLAELMDKENIPSALVFTRTKHGANKVAWELAQEGIPAAAIHGNKSQTARQQALSDFKAGRIRALVATDIAARGLDIEDLSHVFNYNLPEVPETYVHRIGRTGRAGKGGTAIALCDYSEKPLLAQIEAVMGRRIPVVDDHPWPMQVFEAAVKDKRGRIVNAEDAEARQAARQKRNGGKAEAMTGTPRPAENASARNGKKRRSGQEIKNPQTLQPPKVQDVQADHRTLRPGTQFNTGGQMPNTEFNRPDPLAGEHIMDATARLLAPKRAPSTPARRPEERNAEKKQTDQKRVDQKQTNQKRMGQKRADQKQQSGDGQAKHSGTRRGAQGAKPGSAGSGRYGKQRQQTRFGAKDSTEQKSLMKPYYLSDDMK